MLGRSSQPCTGIVTALPAPSHSAPLCLLRSSSPSPSSILPPPLPLFPPPNLPVISPLPADIIYFSFPCVLSSEINSLVFSSFLFLIFFLSLLFFLLFSSIRPVQGYLKVFSFLLSSVSFCEQFSHHFIAAQFSLTFPALFLVYSCLARSSHYFYLFFYLQNTS